jgi:hypothetical protein
MFWGGSVGLLLRVFDDGSKHPFKASERIERFLDLSMK